MMRPHLCCIIGLLFGCFQAFAQTDSLAADSLVLVAKKMQLSGNEDSTSNLHWEALALFKKADLPYTALRSYRQVYDGWAVKNKPLLLLDSLQAAIASPRRAARNKWEHTTHCSYLLYIGYIYQNYLKDYHSAKYYYEMALAIFTGPLKSEEHGIAKYIYHQLGNIYTRLGDYERAKYLLKRKYEYGKAHKIPEMNNALADLALVYFSEGKLDSAKATLDLALNIPNPQTESRFALRQNIASYWLRKKMPEKALEALNEAAILLDSTQGQISRKNYLAHQANWCEKMATSYLQLSSSQTSFEFYKKSIAAWLESQAGARTGRELAKTHIAYGKALLAVGQPTEALAQCQLALQCVLPDFEPIADENPSPSLFIAENAIYEALEQKAACLENMGRLEAALDCYSLIPTVAAKLRETYQYQSSSLLLLAEKRQRLEKGVSLARQLFDNTGDLRFAQQAFHFTELARGELLLESLAANAAAENLPPSLRQREQELESRIAWCEQEAASKQRTATLGELENWRFNYLGQLASLQDSLKLVFPNYLSSKQEVAFAQATDVAAILHPGQALASYFIEGDSILHVFFFDEIGRFNWRSTVLEPGFPNEVFDLASNLGSENQLPGASQKMAGTAYALYQLLLQPELTAAKRMVSSLVVVPDGNLSQLPFEVLLQQPAQPGASFADMDFLLKKMAVSTLPSATVGKLFLVRFEEDKTLLPFAGFAPKYDAKTVSDLATRGETADSLLLNLLRGGLYDLPGAREEVRQINNMMGGDNFSSDLARKSSFKQEAHRYRILHLAMHALTDRKNPALGRLIFTQKEGDAERDFTLFANELGSLSLHAELAVLSACNTGTGKWHQGEGVFSLARAFHLAGVPSVVMSLWRLPDSATPEIMVDFYKNLKANKPKEEALRLAKLDYLSNHKASPSRLHPFYWAGLVLSGR